MRSHRFLAPALACAIGTAASFAGAAEEAVAPDDARPGSVFHPEGPGRGHLGIALGALVDVLPTRVTQSETRTIPKLTGALRAGLPGGVSADLRVSAIVVSNEVSLGLGWTYARGPWSVRPEVRQAFWYGTITFEGYDATGWGILHYPGLALGVALGPARISLELEAIVSLAQHVKLGDAHQVTRRRFALAGESATLVVENPLRGGGNPYFGVGLLRTDADYQAWIAFAPQSVSLVYPRFVAGYGF
jgi:hypothetical protein